MSDDSRPADRGGVDEVCGGASPNDYGVAYINRIPDDVSADSLAIFNAGATAWASAVGCPANIGLERMAGGPEQAQEHVAPGPEGHAAGGKAFADVLLHSGVIFDAGLIMHLANQEERRQAREAA